MRPLSTLFNTPRKLDAWLFACCAAIYFLYFHHVFFNINSVLTSITSDALKNYYTYVYHVTNDSSMLHFEGMNYPFGEHVVYTDCQPLLTFILRLLPFTHGHLIGILHALIFLSYIVTPLVLNRILLRLHVSRFAAFFMSLAIALLSPQFWRLDGHFALTYECCIPLLILFLMKLLSQQKTSNLVLICAYNTAMFLMHPYLGFGLSLFAFLAIATHGLLRRGTFIKSTVQAIVAGLLPIVLFKTFLALSDLHANRTAEPFGIDVSLASIASVFVANYGPFESLLKKCISNGAQDFEGLAYLGFFTVLLCALFIIATIIFFRKLKVKKDLLALFLSAFLLLLFSFGLHNQIAKALHLELSVFNQFRSLGRFAWFFYYMAPLFILGTLHNTLAAQLPAIRLQRVFGAIAIVFFGLNMFEAHYYFNIYVDSMFRDRNIFRQKFLNDEEQLVVKSMAQQQAQGIMALPNFFIGSEIYSRIGGSNSMLPAMIYSYHAKVPIVGGSLSRTSITETEQGLELLNAYKKNRAAMQMISDKPFLVLKTKDELLPDEARLAGKMKAFAHNDSLVIGYVSNKELLDPMLHKPYRLHGNKTNNADSSNVIYIRKEERTPYLPAKIGNYETVFNLDSNILKTGNYIFSLHYHFKTKNYKAVYCNLIVTKNDGKNYEWKYSKPIRLFSGFYNGFAVFEHSFYFERNSRYEFIIKGDEDRIYHISDFMLRPDSTDVSVDIPGNRSLNNYPQ